jgi:CRP-like cAMP-binding protein
MGCIWYALGTMDCFADKSNPDSVNNGCSWITDYYGTDWDTVPLQRRYTASIYWAVTTMATVGYGDINTQNDKERGFAVFAMCVGASAFGYTIGIISDLVQNSDIVAVEKKAKMNQFVNYGIDRHLPYFMKKRVKKHWAYLCQKEGVFPEAEMLAYMPLELQRDAIKTKGGNYREMCLQVEGLLAKGPRGIQRTPQFVLAVIPRLVPLYCDAGEVLFEEYMVGWHVYYIISGNIQLEVHVDGVKVKWKDIGAGDRFGENFVTDGSVGLYTATSIEDTEDPRSEMTSLDREDVMELAATFPELLDELKEGADKVDRELVLFKDSKSAHETAAAAPDEPLPLQKHERGELSAKEVESDREKGIFHNVSATQLWDQHKMIHPETMRKIQWDLVVGMMIVWSVIIVPMRIAFNVEPVGGMLVLDILIDICFGIDLVCSFRTAYFTSHRELIYDTSKVTMNYLKTWFFIDFVTTFPIDRVAAAFVSNPAQLRSIKMLRVLRLARLAKIGKILSNGPMFELFEDMTAGINPSVFKLIKLFLQMFFCAHLIGCLWHYVCNFEDESWVSGYFNDPAADDDQYMITRPEGVFPADPDHWKQTNLQSRYLTSVYWALATMTTVGYGDISAASSSEMEMVVAMLSMLIGTTIFAYVIGEVVMAVLNFNPAEKELARKKRSLKKFIEHHRLAPKGAGTHADEEPDLDHIESADMSARKGLLYSVEMTSVFDTETLFKRTPEFLQRQLIEYHYSNYIERSPMLTKLDHMFSGILVHIFPVMRPILVSPDVDVVTKGDRVSSMYILQEGECRVREHESYIPGLAGGHTGVLPEGVSATAEPNVRNDDDVFANRKKYEFLPGDYFMEHAVFIPEGSHCRAQLSVRAAGNTKTKLMELRRADFMKLQDVCPVAFEFLRSKWNHPNDEWTVWAVPEKKP